MQQLTKPTKQSQIIRAWHLIDAKDKVLGRVATLVAGLLMGKNKPYFVRNFDCGDYVVIINGGKVAVTGKKLTDKMYGRYSGFPGGLKKKPFWQVREEKPTLIIRNAVFGMLPKNKLRDKMITRLFIYPESTHPYTGKFKGVKSL